VITSGTKSFPRPRNEVLRNVSPEHLTNCIYTLSPSPLSYDCPGFTKTELVLSATNILQSRIMWQVRRVIQDSVLEKLTVKRTESKDDTPVFRHNYQKCRGSGEDSKWSEPRIVAQMVLHCKVRCSIVQPRFAETVTSSPPSQSPALLNLQKGPTLYTFLSEVENPPKNLHRRISWKNNKQSS